jgi:hypothetical protein
MKKIGGIIMKKAAVVVTLGLLASGVLANANYVSAADPTTALRQAPPVEQRVDKQVKPDQKQVKKDVKKDVKNDKKAVKKVPKKNVKNVKKSVKNNKKVNQNKVPPKVDDNRPDLPVR